LSRNIQPLFFVNINVVLTDRKKSFVFDNCHADMCVHLAECKVNR